jgi:hypothetical protein
MWVLTPSQHSSLTLLLPIVEHSEETILAFLRVRLLVSCNFFSPSPHCLGHGARQILA